MADNSESERGVVSGLKGPPLGNRPLVFVGGPFTRLLDPVSGTLPEKDRKNYLRLIDFFSGYGFDVENAHRREDWGASLMPPDECTLLDYQALRRAVLFAAYPGSPFSPGTMVEIGWMSAMSKPMVLLVERGQQLPPLVAGMHTIAPVRYVEVTDGVFEDFVLRQALHELLGKSAVP